MWAGNCVLEREVEKICSTLPIRMSLRQYLVTLLYHTYAWTPLGSVHLRREKRPYHPISSSPSSLFCLPLLLRLLILTSHSPACDMYGLPNYKHTHTHIHTTWIWIQQWSEGGSVRLWEKLQKCTSATIIMCKSVYLHSCLWFITAFLLCVRVCVWKRDKERERGSICTPVCQMDPWFDSPVKDKQVGASQQNSWPCAGFQKHVHIRAHAHTQRPMLGGMDRTKKRKRMTERKRERTKDWIIVIESRHTGTN